MTEITINRTCAIIDRCEQFTSGRVGARIEFSFSSEWAGLNKTAVFTNGDTTIDVLNVADEIVIPHEVLAISGKKLKVGVYGFTADDDGNIEIAIPTVYAELGKVAKGADPSGDESTEPSLPVWAQIQSEVNALENRIDGITQPTKVSQLENDAGYITAEDLPDIPSLDDYAKKQYVDDATTELKEDLASLDERVEELEQHGGGGEGTSDHRQLTNRDAANQHPISAITGLQSALDGKQDIITDLATIRSGAALGATALQSVPNTYAKKTDIPTAEISANTAARHTHNNKSVLDGITGIVTADKVNNPDHTTDVVNYAAFSVASGQIISRIPTVISQLDNDSGYLTLDTLPIYDGGVR